MGCFWLRYLRECVSLVCFEFEIGADAVDKIAWSGGCRARIVQALVRSRKATADLSAVSA